jgi:uncharacterized protein (TIRG00374 family)
LKPAPGRARRVDWKGAVGILLGALLLVYSLRGVPLAEVLHEIRRANPFLFLASIAMATAPILVRTWRWRALLEPVRKDTRFRSRWRASMIGFMANNVLPARIGEFARAYALSRMEPIPVVASFGSLVVERLLDGMVVVGFFFLAMSLPGFPLAEAGGARFALAARSVLILMAVAGIVLLGMVVWSTRTVAVVERVAGRVLPASFRRPVVDGLRAFLSGLAALRQPRLVVRAVFWSVGVWLVNTYAFWLGFRAFGIDVPFSAALFLQSLVALAVALPSAPGFFGLWEAAARVGLHEIWGVELEKALGFAIGFHMGSFLPVTVLGLYYAWRLGISFGEVERSEDVVETAIESTSPPQERSAR